MSQVTTAAPIVVIGAGGFGREVHDVIVAINAASADPVWHFLGFVDDGTPDPQLLGRRNARHLGGTNELPSMGGTFYVIGVGNPVARRRLAEQADAAGLRAATLVHPSATMGLDVEVGEGSIICSHVSITTNVRIGRHVHLDQNVAIGHDTTLRDFSRVNPGATVSGNVTLDEERHDGHELHGDTGPTHRTRRDGRGWSGRGPRHSAGGRGRRGAGTTPGVRHPARDVAH